jgi:magnesium transporter
MIQVYENINGALNALPPESVLNGQSFFGCWVNMVNPDDKEIELVCKKTGVAEDLIKAALDEEETSRIEMDDCASMVLFNIPVIEDEEEYYTYSTLPFAYIRGGGAVITVCLNETTLTTDFVNGRVKDFSIKKPTRFLLQILYKTAVKFLQYLKQIDKASQRIQSELHKSMKNKELIQLLDLENSLVYFSTALRTNQVVLDKLQRIEKNNFYEEDEDLWEDVSIENRQALEMCNIFRDILTGTMDAFASLISNNLNIVMKLLAALTILIAVPSMIAAFWGMNTKVPWEGKIWGFWIVIGISVVSCIVTGLILFKKKMLK